MNILFIGLLIWLVPALIAWFYTLSFATPHARKIKIATIILFCVYMIFGPFSCFIALVFKGISESE